MGSDDDELLWKGALRRLHHLNTPAHPWPAEFLVQEDDLPGALFLGRRVVVLVGEVGSGRGWLLHRIRKQVNGAPVVWFEGDVAEVLSPVDWDAVLGTLRPASGGLILARGLEHLRAERREHVLGLFRAHGESHDGTRVLVAGEDDRALHDGIFSIVETVSTLYKMSWFRADDLGVSNVSDPVAEAIIRHTGGQPVLVKDWLQRVKAEGSSDHGDDVARQLMRSPPACVHKWQRRLAALSLASSQLREHARAMVLGQTFRELPDEVRPLYLAGWTHPLAGVWRMPLCHRAWARDVLHRPERYFGGAR